MVFKAINWSPNEIIGETKIDAMTDNAEYLFKNTPRAVYTLPGTARGEGVKIASGRAVIAKSAADHASVAVSFGNFFSSNCQPNISTGIVSQTEYRIFCIINGIGTLVPDNTGFRIEVNIANSVKARDKILRSFYVTWNAMGY